MPRTSAPKACCAPSCSCSPMPHARVTRIDTSAALAMPGVKAILTADDLPGVVEGANLAKASSRARSASGPHDRAALPRRADPGGRGRRRADRGRGDRTDSRRVRAAALRGRPAGDPAARRPERAGAGERLGRAARRAAAAPMRAPPPRPPPHQRAEVDRGGLRRGGRGPAARSAQHTDEWVVRRRRGRTSRTPRWCSTKPSSGRHQPSAARDAHGDGLLAERQAVHALLDAEHGRDGRAVARWVGMEPKDVVVISEYTGGGFGSKARRRSSLSIPALLSKKANAPVMMRITPRRRALHRPRPPGHASAR